MNYAINVENISVSYHEHTVLDGISVAIPSGVMVAIAGPNGGGKTTFIKSILNLVNVQRGSIAIFDHSFSQVRNRIAYIPQRMSVDWDFPLSVLDVVLMGRYSSIGWFFRPKQEDIMMAYEALQQVNLVAYADRHISELSGGQQQRVFLARALVQNADLYLLDEPFVGIDIPTEKLIVALLKKLCAQGKTVVVVHHDLQTLSDYFDWVLLLNKKKIAFGRVQEICMPEYICQAYGERNILVQR
jgi:ABC-type Mn/Zn transport systems, ATPase component